MLLYLARTTKCLSQLQRWLRELPVTALLAWRVSLGGWGEVPLYFLRPLRRASSWMRGVSSFWRSGSTKVERPAISKLLWPTLMDASLAPPPTCCRQVMLERWKECGPRLMKAQFSVWAA